MRVKAEVAAEAFDKAQVAVDDVVSAYLTAEQQLAVAQKKADGDRDRAAGRIIALCQSGGELGVYSTVLEGDGVVDIYDRIQMARTVISGDQSVITDSTTSLAEVDKQQERLSVLRGKQAALEAAAGARADDARPPPRRRSPCWRTPMRPSSGSSPSRRRRPPRRRPRRSQPE